MKMAKASQEDMEGALALAQLTESACHPRAFSMPAFPDTDEVEGKVIDLESINDLRAFYDDVKKGSNGLERVVFGNLEFWWQYSDGHFEPDERVCPHGHRFNPRKIQ